MDPLAERLRLARERQGRTLRELSAETKIREPFLEALEKGRYNVLPAVYMRSFIRTAGAALQIPAKEINALMAQVFDAEDDEGSHLPASLPSPPKTPSQPSTPSKSFWDRESTPTIGRSRIPADKPSSSRFPSVNFDAIRIPAAITRLLEWRPTSLRSPLVLAMAILACIAMFVLIWALFLRGGSDSSRTIPGGADSVLEVDANQALGGGGSTQGAISESDSMLLTAVATDTAWLNITSDDKRSQQVVVLPGNDYRWSAMQRFVLSVSNAGVVTFSRNGQALKPFGKNGEVVRSIIITRKSIQSSATVVKVPAKPAPPPTRPVITPAPQLKVDPTRKGKIEPIRPR